MAGNEGPGLGRLLAFGLPAVPMAALVLPLYVMVPSFYASTLGLSLASVGVIFLIIRLIDAGLDPLIGFASDRVAFSIGRRRGFFLLGLPMPAIGAFMLFWPPQDAGPAYLLTWGIITSVGYTLVALPHTAWGAELSTTYLGRARVSAVREGLTIVGTLLAIILPFAFGQTGADGIPGLAFLGMVVLVALPVVGGLAVWLVPEPIDAGGKTLSIGESLGHLAGNKPFVRLIIAFLLNGFANAIPATLFLYFVGSRLAAPEWQGPFLALYFLSALFGVPLASVTSARFGKHRSWCYGMIAACGIFLLSGFLGPGDILAFGIICCLTGILLGFDLALPPAIQGDVIDEDTLASGEQRSGLYFAAWALVTKLSAALAVGLVFPLLSYAGFDAAHESQTPMALTWLSALYAWLPIVAKLLAISLMWNFPIDAKRQAQTRAAIDAGINPQAFPAA